ncbi:VCBS domain-containing protein, partial [Aestuariicella sp. G3-2]|uniref:VCBS domain-containing protein n=1 Tax=Pseudomaricurvus albidus TaxID=2842452 RepID=UPI001C0E78FE
MTDVPSNNTPKDKQLPDENLQQGGKQKAKLSAGQEAELKSENDKAQESFKQREERLAREVKSAPERHSRPDENEPEGWDVSSDAELPQEADAKSEGSFSSGSTPLAQDAISDSADSVALPFSPAVSENTGIQLATDQWTQLPLRDGITQDSLPKLLAVWEMFGEAIEDVNDSNPLSYSSDAQVSGFNLHADGSYAFDPSHSAYQHLLNGQSHQLIIPVTVTNNHGVSGTLNLSLSLVGWNNEPVLQQAAVSIREDASLLAGQLQAKDIDTGDSLVFSTRAQVDGFSLNADGSYTFDPSHAAYQSLSENQPLVLKIPVMVTDGHGGTATSDLSITVIGTNDGPVLQQAAVTTREDANLLTGQLQATDVDNGDTLVFSIAAPVDGFSFNADGSYSFDPAHSAYQYLSANQPLMVKVPVTVTDSQGAVETCDVLITVIGTNDGPVLQQAAISTREDASLLTGQLQAVDTDTRDTLLFTTTTPVDGFTLNADGSYTFDPSHAAYQSLAAGQPMIQTIEVSVGDGHGGVDRQQLTITLIGTDDAPKLGTLQVLEVKEDSGVIRDRIAVSDVDQHETLLFSVASPQDGFVLYPDGSWKFDPSHPAFQHLADGEVKELRIPVTVTDHSGLSDTQILLIHVTGTNDQPSITTQAPPLNLHEGDARVEGDFSAIDRDSTDVLTFTTPAPIPGFAIDQRGHWSFDPTDPAYNKMPAGDVKKLNIPVIVEDGHGGSDQRVLHIVLNGTNDKPEVQVTPLRNVQEDHLVHDRLVSSDPDSGDTRTFSVPGHVDGFTLTADGSYSFDASHPAYQLLRQDEVKDVMVPVIVTDRQGAQSWTTLTFRLHGTNDVPVVGGISHAIGALDTAVGGTLRVAGELTVVDADSSESSFQAQLLHGSYGVLAITPDGHWSYTADAHQSALHSLSGSQHLPETFTVLTKDGTSHEIKLEIRGDNTPAIFGNVLSGTVKEDVINSVTAKATLIDPDTGENHFQAVDQNTAHGHITMDSDGTWTYTLNRGDPEVQALAEGTSLTERILIGSADGTPHFLTVLVAGTNDAPLISGVSSGAVQEDVGSGSVSATLTGNDPDTGDVLTWSLEGSGQGTYGSLSLDTATGTWTYQIDNSLPAVNELAAGDSQPDTFVVMLTDKLGAVTRHDITVTVNGSNDAPVITATAVVSGGVTEDNTANTVSGSLTATDADSGASLTWSLDSTDGTYGTIAIDPDTGRWTYTLDNHRAGTQALAGGHTEQDTFIATVTDEHGELVRHTITIDVTGNNDVAVIKGVDTGSITEDALAGRTKTLYAGGQLTITDVDAGEAQFQPATA